ncbi:MAG TPA: hypothetical protein VGX49_11920 [Jatrophihabitans sp.]|nr:hypothetical protein [Jatrophihabitans sp.]
MATAAVASDRPGTVPEQPAGTDQTPGPDTGDRDADNPHADTLHADDLHADDLHADDLQADNLDAEPAELVSRPLAAEPSRRTPAWLVVVMAILLVALAGLDGWLVATRPDSGSRAERDQALSTAKTAVPLILSYDYQHFDSAVSAAKAQLTGRAVEDYVRAMTKTIQPSASKAHSVVQAQTDGAGVEAVSGNGKQVTVVVFGEQKVTNISLTAPRIDLFRVRVTLDLVQGRWLVSKFDQI